MISRRISLLVPCFWVILVASSAAAGPPLRHHDTKAAVIPGEVLNPHAHKAVSPFEVEPGKKRLHCELLGHNPLLPCPHHRVPAGDKDTRFLTKECGSGPFSAPSSRSMGELPRFLVSEASVADDSRASMNTLKKFHFYYSFFSHSLDRPPRAL